MARKGQINKLMAWLIAAAVLVIVIAGIVNSGIFANVKNIVPTFNQTPAAAGLMGEVRYHIPTGEVRRWDGEWKPINEPIALPTMHRAASGEEIKQDFDEYYLGNSRPLGELHQKDGIRVAATDVIGSSEIVDLKGILSGDAILSRGSVRASVQRGGNTIVGYYYINMNSGTTYIEYTSDNKAIETEGPLAGDERINMIFAATQWRDSVLEKPISIAGECFEVTRADVYFLKVDLTQRASCI